MPRLIVEEVLHATQPPSPDQPQPPVAPPTQPADDTTGHDGADLDRLRRADIAVEFVARARSLASAVAVRARGAIGCLPDPSTGAAA